MIQADEKLLNRDELARKLRVCKTTVDKLVKDGLPRIFVGRQPRFNYPDVLDWLKGQTTTSTEG